MIDVASIAGGGMLKQAIKKVAICNGCFQQLLSAMSTYAPRVLLWHRFSSSMEDNAYMNSDIFGWQLDQMRMHYQVLTFGDAVAYYLDHTKWPERSVVLTIDDGYQDFYRLAYPQLKARGLRATLFVTVNFVSQSIWLWPDRLHWALQNSQARYVDLPIGAESRGVALDGRKSKALAWQLCSDHCIGLTDDAKEIFIKKVEEALQVRCPVSPPHEYSAVTWKQLREMSQNGIEIGSHTMNHPLLSKVTLPRLEKEICDSKRILEQALQLPVLSFCYPNGQRQDINDEVVACVKRAGYKGAVSVADQGYFDLFTVPRIGVSNDREDFLWKLHGGETLCNTGRRSYSCHGTP